MIAVDTNILIYAHRAETQLHAVAARELIALAEGAAHWGLPMFCAVEFLRVVTHRGETDVMIAGRTESAITPLAVAGFRDVAVG